MEWFTKTLMGGPSQTEGDGEKLGEKEEDGDCLSCSAPCDQHANYPYSLTKRINQTATLLGTGPTAKGFKQHVVICMGTDESLWPEKIGRVAGTLDCEMGKELKKQKLPYSVLLTVADTEPEDTGDDYCKTGTYDVMIFPAGVKYLGVNVGNLDSLLAEHFQGKTPTVPIPKHLVKHKYHIFICTHKKRDNRCGVAGTMLVDEFNKYLLVNSLSSQFSIVKTTHFGGHKYAGNVIIYPGGIWYGRVIPCHVEAIIRHTMEGAIVQKLWRGNMPALHTETKDLSW